MLNYEFFVPVTTNLFTVEPKGDAMKKSIQSKFLIVIISAMLTLGIAISLISVAYINTILNNDSDIITESVANTEALKINDSLDEIEGMARIMESYVLSTLKNVAILKYDSLRDEYTNNAKETFLSVTQSSSNVVAYYLRFAPEISTSTAGFFISCQADGKELLEFEPTDLTNWQEAPKEKVCWYSEPMKAGKPIWLLPYHNPNNDIEIISYVIPLYVDHTFIGVAGIDMKFETLTNMVDQISVYDNGFAYLSSEGENILYSATDEHTLNKAHTDHGFAEEQRTLDNRMTLVIHADYSDIQRDSYRMIMMILACFVFIMTFFIIATYVITRKIVRPLKQLAVAAETIADGNTELNLDSCNTGDEVEFLANSMKKTSEKLRAYMSYINALAYRDSLTGVKNATAFKDAVTNININIRTKSDVAFAVLAADMNMLKATNDHYGHDIGNKLIVTSAKVICDTFKHSPVFRIGGDEFVVILENEDLKNYSQLISEFDKACAESFIMAGDERINVSIARGIECYTPGSDTSFEDVAARADRKMYENKQEFKNK